MKLLEHRWNMLIVLIVACVDLALPQPCRAEEAKPEIPNVAPTRSEPSTAPKTKKRETYPFRGRIASFDANAKSVVLEGRNGPRTVQVIPETRLMRFGKPALPEDLKPGEEIGGTLRKAADGKEEALLIRIGPKTEPEAAESEGSRSKSRNVLGAGAP